MKRVGKFFRYARLAMVIAATSPAPAGSASLDPGEAPVSGAAASGHEAGWGEYDFGALPAELEAVLAQVSGQPLVERIGAISAVFLGRPYQEGPTGEGLLPDLEPPVRYEVFDCVTFIEEVLVLALAADPASAAYYRRLLRYWEGEVSYAQRRHFFAAEWMAGNIAQGILRDITGEVGEAKMVETLITADTWTHWRRRSLFALPAERFPVGMLRVPVLPLDEAERVVERVPPGTVVVTVRTASAKSPIVVTHVGITVPAAEPTVRHATKMGRGGVVDHRLLWYVQHLQGYSNWPVAGISLLAPLEQGPRSSRLVTSAEVPPADPG